MSAMNGSAVSPRRALAVCMALALLVSGVLASSAFAKKAPATPTAYVALGDSISFGYKQKTFIKNEEKNAEACAKHEQAACEPPSSFEKGFVGDFGRALAKIEKGAGHKLSTINLGCPGETSGGLVGNGPLGSAIEAGREAKSEPSLKLSAPCGYENVDGFSLKTPLGGASELEAAAGLLQEGVHVTAVTINIGSNDELGSVRDCENPTYDKENGFTGLLECIEVEVSPAGHLYPGGVFAHIITNIGVTIGTLRAYGYTGPVVILGFYNPQAKLLPGSDTLQDALNGAVEKTVSEGTFGPGVGFAPIMSTFNPQTTAEAEEQAICTYTEECSKFDHRKTGEGDIHPTKAGYEVMAKAVQSAFEAL
jgi:lysophospholipase L1-like esterase